MSRISGTARDSWTVRLPPATISAPSQVASTGAVTDVDRFRNPFRWFTPRHGLTTWVSDGFLIKVSSP